MTPPTLTRRQLNRAILERQLLLRREPTTAIAVMERLVGMQAQNPGDPYVALAARIEGFDPAELSDDIAERRAVRVTGLMRGTIHLVSARDCLGIRPLMQPIAERWWPTSPFARNLVGLDLSEVVAAGRAVIEERPRSINEIGRVLAERWPDRDVESLGYAARGLLSVVQIPPRGLWGRGGRPVLDTVEHWLGAPPAPISHEDLVIRYLAAFGPATVGDLRTWSSLRGWREIVERLRPGLRTFRDEAGRELFDVPDGPLPEPDVAAPVRFLPEYDNILLSHEDRSRMGTVDLRGVWWKGSVLVDGVLAATWRIEREKERTRLRVGLYRPLPDAELADVEAEAGATLGFLAGEVDERTIEMEVLAA